MTDSTLEILEQLESEGILDEAQVAAADRQLRASAAEPDGPFYLQPLLFGGALIAAAMLTVGFALAFDIDDTGALLSAGVGYLIVAITLHRLGDGGFFQHLALSLSIGGHAFLLIGMVRWADRESEEMTAFLTALLLCPGLYFVYRSALHRFGSCLLVLILAKIAFPAEEFVDALHGFVAVTCAAVAFLLTRDTASATTRPLAYACAAGLIGFVLPISDRGLWFEDLEMTRAWISSIVAALALLWALHWASRRPANVENVSAGARAVAVLVAAGLAALGTPGIPAALFLVVLGHATHHWPVALTGVVALPVFLWKYYYNLDLDFLSKSGVLFGSGLLLLVARILLARNKER